MYKVETRTFERFADAVAEAKRVAIGRHYDDVVMIYRLEQFSEADGLGYWEPHRRVERNGAGQPVVK